MIFETAIIGRVRVDQYFYYIRRPICVTIFTLVLLSQIFASRHVEAMKNAKTANGQKSSNPKIKSVHHNKRFKSMAEAHGLEVEHHPKYGWTITSPGVDLLDFIEQQGWQDLQMVEGVSLLDVLGTLPKGGSRTKKPSSTRKYICPKCGNSCRATKAINIICGDCMDKMIVAE